MVSAALAREYPGLNGSVDAGVFAAMPGATLEPELPSEPPREIRIVSPELYNFTTIKHMAINLLRSAPSKDSLRLRRKVAARDDDFLARLIAA